jgi:hypothetical protein
VKRGKIIIFPIAILFILLVIFLTRSPQNDPLAPRYVPVQSQPTGPFLSESFDWGAPVPFRDGKVWIFASTSRTNHHDYLYDLDHRKVLGELLNGGVAFANQDQTKLLCEGFASPSLSFSQRCIALLNRLSPRKAIIPTNNIESFWVFDLKNNSAHRIGDLAQRPGYGSSWRPAPGFRFGFNVPSTGDSHSFFLCDLEKAAFRKIKFEGKLRGWWSDHEILITDTRGNCILFDVLTDKTATLFTPEALKKLLQDLGLPPITVTPLSRWNGTNYDFFFSGAPYWNYQGHSFLLKADKAAPTLRMFSPDFEFGYLASMDDSEKYYVYNGQSGSWGNGGDGAVHLRSLASNTTTTLVPPDGSGQYALPRICGNTVLYLHSHHLWTIKLDGSANTRLFPAPTNAPPDQKP